MALTTIPASLSATALTLTTAAQPNITSVGTLTGLIVNGTAGIQTGALTLSGANPALVISNSGDVKVNFVRSSNTISYALSSAASGGHGFYDNAASAYDLYMKAGKVGIGTIAMSSYYSKNLVVMADGDNTGGITIAAPATDDTTYLAFADGTSGAATYAGYVGYTHNGDDLFLGAGGATRVTIDSTGNVGIGTSSPRSVSNYGVLAVNGSSGSAIDFELGESLKTTLTQSSGQFEINVVPALPLVFKTSNSEAMRIDSIGNITQTFSDGSNVTAGNMPSVTGYTLTNTINSNGSGAKLEFSLNNGSAKAAIAAEQSATTSSSLNFYTENSGTFAEAMRIDSSGQIYAGGGPQSIAKFTGRANGAAVEFGHGNNSAGYYGTAGAFGSSGSPYIGFSADAEASVDTFTTRGFKGNLIAGENTGALRFLQLTNASATGQTPTERMRMDSAGNLLVRQTSAVVRDTNAGADVQAFWGNQFSSSSATTSKVMIGSGSSQGYVGMSRINTDSKYITNAYIRFDNSVFTAGSEAGFMSFYTQSGGTNAAERMRIDSTGNVNCSSYAYNSSSGIMLYAPQGRIYTDIDFNTFGAEILLVNNRTAGGTCGLLQYRTAAAIEGTIVGSSTGLAISNVSDYRKKQNIRNLTGSLNIIKSLQPRIYEYRTGFGKPEGDHVGFIAHEVQEHIPSMVDVEKDAVYTQEDIDAGATEVTVGQPKYQTVAYSNNEMITRLVQAMQEQQVMIETLQAEVTALKGA